MPYKPGDEIKFKVGEWVCIAAYNMQTRIKRASKGWRKRIRREKASKR